MEKKDNATFHGLHYGQGADLYDTRKLMLYEKMVTPTMTNGSSETFQTGFLRPLPGGLKPCYRASHTATGTTKGLMTMLAWL